MYRRPKSKRNREGLHGWKTASVLSHDAYTIIHTTDCDVDFLNSMLHVINNEYIFITQEYFKRFQS